MNLLISGLKLPLQIITWLAGGKQKRPQKSELEKKQLKHVHNFAPTHYSWQIRGGKKLTKKQREYYRKKQKNNKKFIKSVNKGYYEKQSKRKTF